MNKNTTAVILAAGKGTRMRSKLPKVLHKVAGKAMLTYIIEAVENAGIQDIVVVVGHNADDVKNILSPNIKTALQSEQLGTGHAVMQAEQVISLKSNKVLVLNGDTPLLKSDTIINLINLHQEKNGYCTILSADLEDPHGYGRIIRNNEGNVEKIVEEKDAIEQERKVKEINTGTYCFDKQYLFEVLKDITPDNAQGEYYLTDVILEFNIRNLGVYSYIAEDLQEIKGINNRVHLAEAEKEMRRRKNLLVMESGVTLIDPETTYIDNQVEIGPDTIIYPFTFLEEEVTIGAGCEIGPSTTLKNTSVGEDTKISRSVAVDSSIGSNCNIGPFSYLRPGTLLHQNVKIGDFVEIKKSSLDDNSKVPHLSYIGDSTIEKNVNVGAGTITCNYDGKNKWPTIIEEGAFVGSNTNLVAPVKVGKNSITGAGSTITKDVPEDSLAVARGKQKNILEWNKKIKN